VDWPEKIPWPPAGMETRDGLFEPFVSMLARFSFPARFQFAQAFPASFPVFAFRFHFRFLSLPVSCL
jgi:hypothetical protein